VALQQEIARAYRASEEILKEMRKPERQISYLVGTPKGKIKEFTKAGESGKKVTRQFCADCGTPMFSVPEDNPISIVKAGTLDDPSWLKPSITIWTKSAQPWAHIDKGIPAFEKQPG